MTSYSQERDVHSEIGNYVREIKQLYNYFRNNEG